MDEKIFEGYGITIFRCLKELFIEYDAGQHVPKMKRVKISEEEAAEAKKGEKEAYELLIRKTR